MSVSVPDFNKTISGYSLEFHKENILINLERMTDDGVGELSIIHDNGAGTSLILPRTSVNLLSERTMTSIVNKLIKRVPDTDWQSIIDYSIHNTTEAVRQVGDIEDIDEPPENMKLEYLLEPILLKNQPTTIFSPGGTGKSTIADLIAVLIQYNIVALDWFPCGGNVLYLDWEADKETHRRSIQAIKNGLAEDNDIFDFRENKERIMYLRCETDLIKIIDKVYKVVAGNDIALVIVDSQMAATASGRPGADGAQISSMYFNALRQLPCASLTIDHVSKSAMENLTASNPYGSIVKANRTRSQFELKQQSDSDDDAINIAMFHTKFNLGKRLKPQGIRLRYENENNITKSIRFSKFNVTENEELSKALPIKEQIKAYLSGGKSSVKEISEYLDKSEDSVRTILNRSKNLFINIDGEWGLLDHNNKA